MCTMFSKRSRLAASIVFLFCLAAWSQTSSTAGPPAYSSHSAAGAAANPIPAAPDNYVIGNDDLLHIYIYKLPELTLTVRVNTSGQIRLPFLNQPIQAAGQTAFALNHTIAVVLQQHQFAQQPYVQVTVLQVKSKPIVVTGDVKHPLTLQAARPMPLLEVLSRAGGVNTNASETVVVTSLNHERPQMHSYNLQQLLSNPSASYDPARWLDGNDFISVLPAGYVYVVGDFNQPGAFPLNNGQQITVLRAIALAHGLADSPNKGKAAILNALPGGERRRLTINIDRILKHQSPDLPLHPGDILYVPKDGMHMFWTEAVKDAGQVITLGMAYRFP